MACRGMDLARPFELVPLTGLSRGGTASWKGLKQLIVYYVLLMSCSLALGLVSLAATGPWTDVAFSAIWIALTLFFLNKEWKKVVPAFRVKAWKTKNLWPLLWASACAYGFLRVYFTAMAGVGWPVIEMTKPFLSAGWPLWSAFVMLCVVPGIIEEIAFRGIVQTRLAKILTQKEALVIQAALFSSLHLSPAIFVSHFVMGLLLGWVRMRSGHVYFGMFLHMAWNATVVLRELWAVP